MKNIIALLLVSFIVSCGNPHISSTKDGLERSNPLLEGCEAPEVEVNDHRFFMASAVPSDYSNFTKCRNVIKEDFNTFDDGTVPELSNEGTNDRPYILTHRFESHHDVSKVVLLQDIFGTQTYDFLVSNHSVNTGSVDNTAKDAFVWHFNLPITFWSARSAGFNNGSILRIFNCSEELVDEVSLTDAPTFIGFISALENICSVSLTASNGSNSVLVDDFEYGK